MSSAVQVPPMPTSDGLNKRLPKFLQRPESSVMDATGFSFAKPTSHATSGLRGIPRKPLMDLTSSTINLPNVSQPSIHSKDNGGVDDEKGTSQTSSHGISTSKESMLQLVRDDCHSPPADSHEIGNPVMWKRQILATAVRKPIEMTNAATAVEHSEKADKGTVSDPNPSENEVFYQTSSSKHVFCADLEMSMSPSIDSSRPFSRDMALEAVRSESVHRNPKAAAKQTDIEMKKARGTRKRKLCKIRTSNSTSKNALHQLTEDNLFELLVDKIRQREDGEAAAEEIRRQLENENVKLKHENQAMRLQLDNSNAQVKQSTAKAGRAESQVEQWKVKIRKFRTLVNDLGHEYDTLRNNADSLREIASSAEMERDEAKKKTEQAMTQAAQAEQKIEDQQTEISSRINSITTLEDKLSVSEGRVGDLLDQLTDHKKKVGTLETYIQNYSLGQAKQITALQKEQSEMSDNIDAGFKLLAQKADDTNSSLATTTKLALEECRSSVQSLGEQFSSGQLDVQNFIHEANQIASQLKRLSVQFSEGVDESATLNSNASKAIQDSLREIDHHFGLDSPLTKRLDHAEKLHHALVARIQIVDPKLSSLCDSFSSLGHSEDKLTSNLENFSKKLDETLIQTGNPILELEISRKYDENAQLQVQVHDLSSQAESLQKQLRDSVVAAKSYCESHEESKTTLQALQIQLEQLRTENLALQGDIETTKVETRERIDQKNQDLKKMQTEQELQLASLQKEKRDIEEASTDLIKKMSDTQHALIEARRIIDKQRKEREVFSKGNEQKILELTKSYSDANTQMLAHREEMQRFQELDASSRVENSSLREQLEQAQDRILSLQSAQALAPEIKEPESQGDQTIVPFAVVKEKIPSPTAESPFHDSCDFAMLFMSDEEAEKSMPFEGNTRPSENTTSNKNVKSTQKTAFSAGVDRGASKNASTKRKRKVSISDAPVIFKSIEKDPSIQDGDTEENTAADGSTSKVSKHVHKWTYSRIHSTATQLNRQQSSTSVRAPIERCPSPKGLVSASSAVSAPKRKNPRGRGKGRSRSDRYNARFQADE